MPVAQLNTNAVKLPEISPVNYSPDLSVIDEHLHKKRLYNDDLNTLNKGET